MTDKDQEVLLPVSPDVIAYLMRSGMSEADAIRGAFRVFRPGGPFDDAEYLTQCCVCSVKKAQTLRWFQDHDFSCECGGKIDGSGLYLFNEAITNRDYKEADRIYREFFRPIPYVEG